MIFAIFAFFAFPACRARNIEIVIACRESERRGPVPLCEPFGNPGFACGRVFAPVAGDECRP